MRTNVKATNFSLNVQISEYLDKKLNALTKLFDDTEAAVCGVELARDTHHSKGDVFRAEMTLEIPGAFFRAQEEGETVYSAIDAVQEELLKELRRDKRKRVHLLRWGGHVLKEFTQEVSARGTSFKEFLGRFRRKR